MPESTHEERLELRCLIERMRLSGYYDIADDIRHFLQDEPTTVKRSVTEWITYSEELLEGCE
jgi:hypothetical protein